MTTAPRSEPRALTAACWSLSDRLRSRLSPWRWRGASLYSRSSSELVPPEAGQLGVVGPLQAGRPVDRARRSRSAGPASGRRRPDRARRWHRSCWSPGSLRCDRGSCPGRRCAPRRSPAGCRGPAELGGPDDLPVARPDRDQPEDESSGSARPGQSPADRRLDRGVVRHRVTPRHAGLGHARPATAGSGGGGGSTPRSDRARRSPTTTPLASRDDPP